jgi:hypothetical protein
MTGVGEALVAYPSGHHASRSARGPRDRGGVCKSAQSCGGGEACGVVADFGEDACGENRSRARGRAENHSQRVIVELCGESVLKLFDRGVHRDDNAGQADDSKAEGLLHCGRLTQRGDLQISQDLFDEGGVIAATAALQ